MPSRDRDLAASEAMIPPASPGAAPAASNPARKTARHAAAQPVLVRGAGLIAYLAVLICVAAGIYVAWHQGGGHAAGRGGAIAGATLLVAAVARLALPRSLVGLLAVRNRGTDAVTLLALGTCLLTVGLVLPG
jgi:Protein of unknown function (DUF3017)